MEIDTFKKAIHEHTNCGDILVFRKISHLIKILG
jgi:hypothetical protein